MMVEGKLETWSWYCRLDGQAGTKFTRTDRDAAALRHRDQECGACGKPHAEWAEYGHLVHVWRW